MKEIVDALEKYTKKDIFYNKEKFAKGDTNVLYIVGYSGSGKTTLSRIAKKFSNVEIIEFDLINYASSFPINEIKKLGKTIYTFFKMFERDYNELGNIERNHEEEMNKFYGNFNKFILKYSKKHNDKIYIIEGTQSLNSYLDKELPDVAIIVKNISFLKSFLRAAKRNALYTDWHYTERIKNPFMVIKKFFKMLFNRERWEYYKKSKAWIKKIRQKIQSQR